MPVIHGADPTMAPARRWKSQLNENAKAPAFASVLPEADHNEICGWDRDHGSLSGSSSRIRTSTRASAAASS